MLSEIRRSTTWSKIQAKPIQRRRSRTASTARDQQGEKGADGLGLSEANGSKASRAKHLQARQCLLGRGAAPAWRESKWWRAVEASNSPDGRAISLTDSWFSATQLQASQTLVAWFYFILAWLWRYRDSALPYPGRLFDLSGSAGSELPSRPWHLGGARERHPYHVARRDCWEVDLHERLCFRAVFGTQSNIARAADQHISINPRKAEKMSLTGTGLKAEAAKARLTRTLGPVTLIKTGR